MQTVHDSVKVTAYHDKPPGPDLTVVVILGVAIVGVLGIVWWLKKK